MTQATGTETTLREKVQGVLDLIRPAVQAALGCTP